MTAGTYTAARLPMPRVAPVATLKAPIFVTTFRGSVLPGFVSDELPAELRAVRRWGTWRYVQKYRKDGTPEPKPSKVPYIAGTTTEARSNALGDWRGYDDAVAAWRERDDFFTGIGFLFARGDGRTGIDFDNCVDPATGAITDPWVAEWVRRLNSRTELSPSRTGLKVIVRGTLPRAFKTPRVEGYSAGRYFTITGVRLASSPHGIRDAQAELDALYAEVRPNVPAEGDTTPADIDDAQVQAALAEVGSLLASDGIPRRLHRESVGHKILTAALAGWPEGTPDYSGKRFALMESLLLRGYSDTQIAAFLWHYRKVLNGGDKSIKNWGADIARVLGKLRAKHPTIVPSPERYTTQHAEAPSLAEAPTPPAKPKKPARPRGRPKKIANGASGYLDWLRTQVDPQSGTVLLSVQQCAERLGVDKRTVQRYEAELREAGAIERHVFANYQAGALYILSNFVTTSSQTVVTGDAVLPQTEAVNPGNKSEAAPLGEHRSSCAPTAPAPRVAVAEAFEHLAPRYARVTWQRIQMFIESAYPTLTIPVRRLRIFVDEERARRGWEKQIAALATMPYKKLSPLSKRIDRVIAEGKGAKGYAWAAAMAPHVNTEMERRDAMGERADVAKLRRRRRDQEQTADRAVAQLRAERARPCGAERACVLPLGFDESTEAEEVPPAPAAFEYGPGYVDGMLTRLRQRLNAV